MGKDSCKILKEIRRRAAEKLGIDLEQSECTFEGECSGTCPKCRQEEEKLNSALLGKATAVALTASLAVGVTGCAPYGMENRDSVLSGFAPISESKGNEQISGDVERVDDELNTENETTCETESKSTENHVQLTGDVAPIR